MPKAEWGVKRTCLGCGARFYDLKRDPIICPKCDAEFVVAALVKPKRAKPATPAKDTAAVADVDTDDLIDDEDVDADIDDDAVDPDAVIATADDDDDADDVDTGDDAIVAKGADADVLLDDDADDDDDLDDVKIVKTNDDDLKDG
ncbi:MAG: TIGR02300 family protein [Paracoccaceae bacterium]